MKFKKFLMIFLCLSLCFLTTSCIGEDYEDKSIIFATGQSISTFDPQLVKTSAEVTVATNSFEGILTKDSEGNIINGCAESYTVNSEKTVYTFKIRDGLMWSDGETKLTAKDFEFGIKRAVMPETESPYVSVLYSIKNAQRINKNGADINTLGVVADESTNTITITLETADDGIFESLTKPLCFPCNQEYFEETAGKYGLKSKYIISNGAYSIDYFNPDTKTVVIQKNSDYKGLNKGIPRAITINYGEDFDSIYESFKANELDMCEIDCSYLPALDELGNKSQLFYNTNYCLYVSDTLGDSFGANLNKALMLAIDSGAIKNNITDYYKSVGGVVPDVNLFGAKSYRKQVSNVSLLPYNIKNAEKELVNFETASDILNELSLYYPANNSKISLISHLIVQGWQKDLNIFINSHEEIEETILSKVQSGEIKIAIIPVSSENNDAVASFNSLNNLNICTRANVSSAEELIKLEQNLINDGLIYPILTVPTAISHNTSIDGLTASDDGKIIDFRYIKKS